MGSMISRGTLVRLVQVALAGLLAVLLAVTSGFDASAVATSSPVEVRTADGDPEKEKDPEKDADEVGDSDGDGVPDRPDAVSAGVAARLLDEPVEDMSARTESSRTLVNPEGTRTD